MPAPPTIRLVRPVDRVGWSPQRKWSWCALLLVAVALFACMAVCVAALSPTRLSIAVATLLLIQHFSVIGKAGRTANSFLSGAGSTSMFTVISMLNFDVQFVKPGCVVAQLSFLTVYWITAWL